MSVEANDPQERSVGRLPEGAAVKENLSRRQGIGRIWHGLFLFAIIFGMAALLTLIWDVVNDGVGLIATQSEVDEEELTGGRDLETLSQDELVGLVNDNLSRRVLTRLNREQPIEEREPANLIAVIESEILKVELVAVYPLVEALFSRPAIEAELAERFPRAELAWKSWVRWDFLTQPMSSVALDAGVRTAILGSLWVTALTAFFAIPIGVFAAIYLEEYADQRHWYNKFVQTNINNLAGVPSIIYGMLGLAIFVRVLEPFTSGAFFGASSGGEATLNGRTIIAAAFTMALLILPVIIITSQEAIRAVPSSLRQGSYGLGATKWQTVQNIVLPQAFPSILTGIILSVSRAVGETAPLILVGASTFIVTDPTGPFSKFTVLPIQVYTWTQRPEQEFKVIAAAAIIVLLIVMLVLNATAVLLRNYFRSKRVSV
jgi:phosphate transport system permease protein